MQRVDASVVICAYNEEEFVRAALESVFAQDTRRPWEVIVVDDGSTDATENEVNRALEECDPSLRWTYAKIEHAGLSVARNAGVELAEGRVVVFLDADAIAEPDWLTRMINAFDDDEVVGAGGAIKILNEEDAFACMIDCFHHRRAYECADGRVPIIGANMAFLRDVIGQVGGFRAPFVSRGDDDSVRYCVESRGRLVFVPEASVLHTRPKSWVEWLNERRANGRARLLVDQFMDAHPVSEARGISRVARGRLRSSYPILFGVGVGLSLLVPLVGLSLVASAIVAALARAAVYFTRGLDGATKCARGHGLDPGVYHARTAMVALVSTWVNDWSYAKATWLSPAVDWASASSHPNILKKRTAFDGADGACSDS
ncbi:MAG: glycosyltransferase family A protein [Rhodospirillaceae bacterium]